MRSDNQVVVFNGEIVNGRDGQIQLERLPMCAVVERNKHAGFGAGVEKTFAFGVFANGADVRALGNSVYDGAPGFAEITRFENVRFEVIKTMSVYRHVGRVSVMR